MFLVAVLLVLSAEARAALPTGDEWLVWLSRPAGEVDAGLELTGVPDARSAGGRPLVYDPALGLGVSDSPEPALRLLLFLGEGQRVDAPQPSEGYADALPFGLRMGMGFEEIEALLGDAVQERGKRILHADVQGFHVAASVDKGGLYQMALSGPWGGAEITPPAPEDLLSLVGCAATDDAVVAMRERLGMLDPALPVSLTGGVLMDVKDGVVVGVGFPQAGFRDRTSGHLFAAWTGAVPLGLAPPPPELMEQGIMREELFGWEVWRYATGSEDGHVFMRSFLPRRCGADPRTPPPPPAAPGLCLEGDCQDGQGRRVSMEGEAILVHIGTFRGGLATGHGEAERWEGGRRVEARLGPFQNDIQVSGALITYLEDRHVVYSGPLVEGRADNPEGSIMIVYADGRKESVYGQVQGATCVGTCRVVKLPARKEPDAIVCMQGGAVVSEGPCPEPEPEPPPRRIFGRWRKD